jgi:hypothetical protein
VAEHSSSGFVADGQERAWAALEPKVRAEVESEYAEEWNSSGLVRRRLLLRKIEKEIARRLEDLAPSDALY